MRFYAFDQELLLLNDDRQIMPQRPSRVEGLFWHDALTLQWIIDGDSPFADVRHNKSASVTYPVNRF